MNRKKVGTVFGSLTLLFFVLAGIVTPTQDGEVASVTTDSTPTSTASSASTTVPTPSPSSRHNGVLVKVVNVVDGDTIKVETGETVRYIGIDTPETVDPKRPVMCYGKEASNKNIELVEGKIVEMEKDLSEKDKYGRLLRYIWLDDVLINELLVREGYAQSSSYPPDVKYQERFVEAQRLAQKEQIGLWSSTCAVSSTLKPTIASTTMDEGIQTSGGENGSYTCNCAKTCGQMSSCAEAQYQLNVCGCSKRDADGDGIACDSDCQ